MRHDTGGRLTRDGIRIHDPEDFAGMHAAGAVAAKILDDVAPHVRPGQTTGGLEEVIRAAVEAEVLRRAAAACDEAGGLRLDAALAQQRDALRHTDYESFARLDYEFHKILCEIGQVSYAYDVISATKTSLDPKPWPHVERMA